MRHTESRLQVSCVRWFRLQYPNYASNLFAIPNGGKRNSIEASIMKYEGVTAGVPDMFLAVLRADTSGSNIHLWPGMFIEMKTKDGRLSLSQKEMHNVLKAEGYLVKTCRSLDEFIDIVNDYINLK